MNVDVTFVLLDCSTPDICVESPPNELPNLIGFLAIVESALLPVDVAGAPNMKPAAVVLAAFFTSVPGTDESGTDERPADTDDDVIADSVVLLADPKLVKPPVEEVELLFAVCEAPGVKEKPPAVTLAGGNDAPVLPNLKPPEPKVGAAVASFVF